MRLRAHLTSREKEIAELLAWGAAKKEVADHLCISVRTVENTTRSIYKKLSIQKATELSVWWFCTRYNIPFELSPIKRQIVSIVLLLILLPQMWYNGENIVRAFRTAKTQNVRTVRTRHNRRKEYDFELEL